MVSPTSNQEFRHKPFLMTRGLKYLPTIFLVSFIGFFFFSNHQQEKNFKNEIRKIDSAREALRAKVDSLNLKTRERDIALTKILKRNLEIIDTLNLLQKNLERNKQEIDKKIEESKEIIYQYWKNN